MAGGWSCGRTRSSSVHYSPKARLYTHSIFSCDGLCGFCVAQSWRWRARSPRLNTVLAKTSLSEGISAACAEVDLCGYGQGRAGCSGRCSGG